MCAIAGVIGNARAAELVRRMTDAQAHRGPDAGAVVQLALDRAIGHRRLAILDLSENGAQPMRSGDGRWTMVLNGELFNYRELRAELGGAWRSESDTEVFLEAIARWGLPEALRRSIGMFALAVWDHRDETLWLARDRAGEKPLVYFWDGTTFAFASEMKALGELHGAKLEAAAVDVYLALGYVPAPLGIFRNTAKLPAGHLARLDGGRLTMERWWFPENAPAPAAQARGEQLRHLVGDAVRLRLRSDVPLALALSGGIDSSVIAAELAREGATPDAFTVVFDGDESDLPYARSVAQRFGLRHEVIRAETGPLDDAADHYDEPFADSSSVACLALARALVGRYKVILTGDGGDEAFGGYRHYEFIAVKQLVKAAAAAAGLRDGYQTSTTYVQSKTLFRAAERAALLGYPVDALDRLLATDPFLQRPATSSLKHALWTDRHLHLANGLTHKTDIALSAFGMEGRAPLLDHRVLEWAQGLDDQELVRGREKKILLRAAYQNELPPEVVTRAKHGFGGPIRSWMAGPLRPSIARALPCPLLDARPQQDLTGQRQWTLFTFARWAARWGAQW